MPDLSEDVFGKLTYLVRVSDGYFRAGQESTAYPNLAQQFSFSQAEFIAREQQGQVIKARQVVITEEDAIGLLPLNTPSDPPIQQPLDEDPPVAPARRRRSSN